MITPLQRKELDKIKPTRYREKVKLYLAQNGHLFSLETIQKVYSGKRKNIIVAKAIVTVFSNHMQERLKIENSINKVTEQFNNDKS